MTYSIATRLSNPKFKLNPLKPYALQQDDTLGERLRKLRKMNDLTAKELGSKIGFSGAGIIGIENGETFPSPSVLAKLINTLGPSLNLDNYTKYITCNSYELIKTWRKSNKIKLYDAALYFKIPERTYQKVEETSLITKNLFTRIEKKLIELGIIP